MERVTVKRDRKNIYLITAQSCRNKITLEFELKLKMKFSAKYLTEGIRELNSKFASVGIEVYESEIYDGIIATYGKKLPPLLL